MSTMPKNPKKQLLSEAAYEDLKWRILNLELPIGQLFSVGEFCQLVKLGRAPVSHAVLRLQEERLVDVLPRKGIIVKAWSPKSFDDIIEVRRPIEMLSARLAAERADEKQVAELKAMIKEAERHVKDGNRRELRSCDARIHGLIAQMTGNEILADEVRDLHQMSSSVWYSNVSGASNFKDAHKQHVAVLKAIVAGDPDAAEREMAVHMASLVGRPVRKSSSAKKLVRRRSSGAN